MFKILDYFALPALLTFPPVLGVRGKVLAAGVASARRDQGMLCAKHDQLHNGPTTGHS